MTLLSEPQPQASSFDVTGWVLRISAGLLFVAVGLAKFQSQSIWVGLFTDIGLGDWFRYLTGALQAGAGLLILVPRSARVGLVIAGGTMLGAVATHLFVLDTGVGGAIIPAFILIFLTVIGFRAQ